VPIGEEAVDEDETDTLIKPGKKAEEEIRNPIDEAREDLERTGEVSAEVYSRLTAYGNDNGVDAQENRLTSKIVKD